MEGNTLKKTGLLLIVAVLLMGILGGQMVSAAQLTFGYIAPGPDTWYRRTVEGFEYACKLLGVETIVLNSQYDASREVANIDSLITQGVDGMGIFSFNPQGAILAANRAQQAGIPLVTVDNVGQVLETNYDVVGAIDFDWEAMGIDYAEYMAANYPGMKVAIIAGLLDHRPVQIINEAMKNRMAELGQNEIVVIRSGEYDPSVAVNQVQDLVQSGIEFDIIWVMNEDMVAAVIRYLEGQGLLDEYVVIAQNGSPAGLELVKQGKLDYTISSSPGWAGMVAALALYQHVTGDSAELNQPILLPITPVTRDNIENKKEVVPWEVDDIWQELTADYFPELAKYLP
ncbi:MAG: sugar ABC transporter substrate-binding protein [Firmicutes bacterium]|nr:sugar ABC transporter substrate-binding protein [Bacillota bacterium]